MRGHRTLVLAAAIVAMTADAADARRKKDAAQAPAAQQTSAAAAKPVVPSIETRARELMDLDEDGVRARYGQPRLLRKEPPAQVWQYADDACVLLVVLYDPKDGRGRPKVKYARGHMLPGHENDAANCLTGPRPGTPANATALPSASPVVIPGQPLTGTPVYSPGDPVPAAPK
ncbi:hypothetical protein [Emcibacter sp. SYSU 3D8]|uniref:hypothetical protein n=1 Tax=Emcibacter sp. SYSU 3D8 TaxID=3133969 RepID=UPI0031FEA271